MERPREIISATILTNAAVGQVVLSFFLYNHNRNEFVRNTGWVILWISAIFGWLPIFTLQKWGAVPKGKGYVHTTIMVDRGVYGIIRHPQYLAGILLGVGLSLIVQHWIVTILGVVVAIMSYAVTFNEEKMMMLKFDTAYAHYQTWVLRVNFFAGLWRILRKKLGQ
jgi:protein-S-isoprenylcysteine O-methyltransferase Ste14